MSEPSAPPFGNPAHPGLAALRRHWRSALAIHAIIRLAAFAIAVPLLTVAFRTLLAAAGDRVISNFDIAAFLLSPAGALLCAAAAVLAVTLTLVELAGLTHLAAGALAGEAPTPGATLLFLGRRVRTLARLGARILARAALLLLPLAAAAAWAKFAWLGAHDINYYLAEKPPEWRRSLWLVAIAGTGCALAILWQLARWLYAIPHLVASPDAGASAALAESARRTRGRLGEILRPLLAVWLGAAALAVVAVWAGRRIADFAFEWAGMDVRRVLPVVATSLAAAFLFEFVLAGATLAAQQFALMRSYASRAGLTASSAAPRPSRGAAQTAARAVAVVVLAAAAAATVAWLGVSGADLRPRVEVTAHRGASSVAPENSMAAFRAAIAAGTDWIELDVQRLADGAIVVVHDGDFLRVGGDARKVGAVTAADLTGIGFGGRFGAAFSDEHPPLLADVIALVRDRARLNVELKYNVPDPGLAPAVLDLLEREDFLPQSVITSLDYAALRQVEAIEPRAVTGLIVTAAVGDVTRSESDFLSLNAARATPSMVRRAHRAGKAVHVWTVNTREAMLELAARGVDNIITDDPALFGRVKAEAAALDPHALLGLRLRALFGRPPSEIADPARVTAQ